MSIKCGNPMGILQHIFRRKRIKWKKKEFHLSSYNFASSVFCKLQPSFGLIK